MKKFKKITGWLHLWLGLTAGVILIIVALTGSLLTFEDELEPILCHKSQVVKSAAQRLPIDSLMQIANSVFPDKKVSRFIISGDENRSVEIRYGVKGDKGAMQVAYLNQYNGQILYKGRFDQQFFSRYAICIASC